MIPEWYPWDDDLGQAPWARERARLLAAHSDVAVIPARARRLSGTRPFEIDDRLERGVRTLRVGYRELPRWGLMLPFRLAGIHAAMRQLRRDGFVPDLIHANVFYCGFIALLLRDRATPVIVSEHFTGFARGLVRGSARWMADLAYRRAALVCPDSEDLGRLLVAQGYRGRIRPMPNVIDTDVFTPPSAPRAEAPARMLNVASLHDKKGHTYLLQALATLRERDERDWTLEVIGAGPLGPALEREAHDLGLADRVSFAGPRPTHEVADAMRRASFLVLPSLYENGPLVISEAMATGLPVVATAVGGVPDMVGPDRGLVVPARDPGALAVALARMLDAHRDYDADALVRHARDRYGHEAVSRMWLDVYREVLARR